MLPSLICNISKLGQQRIINSAAIVRNLHVSATNFLQPTAVLCAEPLKKKKKVDPAVLKARDDRRKKKIEKQIRRLEKNARQLKPIEELEVPLTLIDQKKQRTRKLSPFTEETTEYRALLEKKWAKSKLQEKLVTFQGIDRLMQAQTKALDELKLVSLELYEAALQPDATLLPFKSHMIVVTPPIENYESPDGEYFDISKKWDN